VVAVAPGDWQGAAATVVSGIGEATGIEELEQVAQVVQTASWSNIANVAVNQVADAVGGDAGAFIRTAGGAVAAAATGDWETVVDTAVDLVGDDLPPQFAQFAHAAADGGWDGAVDWATNNAVQIGTQIASDAFGADAAQLMGQVATAYTTGGTDAVLQMGAQGLDSVIPGAGSLATQVLSGASPDDVMENLQDQARAQLFTVGQQAIHSTGLGDAFDSDGINLDDLAPSTVSNLDTDELGDWAAANLPGGSSAPDLGIGDDMDTPDLVNTAMSTSTGSVSNAGFDDDPGFDDPDWASAPNPVMPTVDSPDVDSDQGEPTSIAQADAVGDEAQGDVEDMFDNL